MPEYRVVISYRQRKEPYEPKITFGRIEASTLEQAKGIAQQFAITNSLNGYDFRIRSAEELPPPPPPMRDEIKQIFDWMNGQFADATKHWQPASHRQHRTDEE